MQIESTGLPVALTMPRTAMPVASNRARDQIPKGVRKPVPSMLMRNSGGQPSLFYILRPTMPVVGKSNAHHAYLFANRRASHASSASAGRY